MPALARAGFHCAAMGGTLLRPVGAVLDHGHPEVVDADLGQEIFPRDQQTPAALHAYHAAEIDKWWPIIKAAGIKPEG